MCFAPKTWGACPTCKSIMKEYVESTADLVELGEDIKHDEPINLENHKNIVIMSLEKYDQMKADFKQCIDERDRALFEQEQELRSLQQLVKALGITPEMAKNVYPDSVTVLMDGNPINYTTRYHIKFDVRR